MITPNAVARQVYLPEGNWIDFWTNELHTGGKNITWTNNNQTQMPLFAREGAIVPMLLTEVQTLCDTNYVNNPNIRTPDSGLQFLLYPAGESQFTVYDGTNIQCQVVGGKLTVTLSSAPRPVILQLLADEPAKIERDGTALAKLATKALFDAAVNGWRADAQARLVAIKFQHTGGVTKINL